MPSIVLQHRARGASRCAILLLAALGTTPAGAEAGAEALSLTCNGCHGPDGASIGDSIPSIAGQDPEYLRLTLERFRSGKRRATIMDRIARGYKVYQLRKMANYFAGKPWIAVQNAADKDAVALGATLHEERCTECHEDEGRYQDKDIPRLAGQGANYLYQQLTDYAVRHQLMPQPTKMAERLDGLSAPDLIALSAYYSQVR